MTSLHFVGDPCGHHGSYAFYKTFGYWKKGIYKLLSLGNFFFVRISATEDPCIGELQLLWNDSNSHQRLSSVRLYFLPEQTPDGRQPHHGEHEVLAASEKMVLRIEDLVEWITEEVQWNHGLVAMGHEEQEELHPEIKNEEERIIDVEGNNYLTDEENLSYPKCQKVTVLSYPDYCRYRALLRRLDNKIEPWMTNAVILALGGVAVSGHRSHIFFCRDTFDHDGLLQNDLNYEHLAPTLKNKPRKKKSKTKRSTSPDAESNTSEDSKDGQSKFKNVKILSTNGLRNSVHKDEQTFLQKLFKFMKDRKTPIQRVPHLGFKQIDLYLFYKKAQKLGGYDQITYKKLWKNIYDAMGGDPGSTSAATCTRKHYERLLLPFERHLKGDENKILEKTTPSKVKIKPNYFDYKETIDEMENEAVAMQLDGMSSEENQKADVDSNCQIPQMKKKDTIAEVQLNVKEEKDVQYLEDIIHEPTSKYEEHTLKIKLEKLPVQEHGKTKELWQQKVIPTKKGIPDILTDKECRWNEIRKKNALARSWARQQRPPKSTPLEVASKHLHVVQEKLVPNNFSEAPSTLTGIQSMSATFTTSSLSHPLPTAPPVFSSCSSTPANSKVSNMNVRPSVLPVNSHMSQSIFLNKSSMCHSRYPICTSCPLPSSSFTSDTPLAFVNSAKGSNNRRNSVTCSSSGTAVLKTEQGNNIAKRKSVEIEESPRTETLVNQRVPYTAVFTTNVTENQTALPVTNVNNSHHLDKKSTDINTTVKPCAADTEKQEPDTKQRRPSVILHTEQIRSPPLGPIVPSSTRGHQTLGPPSSCPTRPFLFPSSSEDQFLRTLQLRPSNSNGAKTFGRRFSDISVNKFQGITLAHTMNSMKDDHGINILKTKETLGNKHPELPNVKPLCSESSKKERCGQINNILLNRKLHRIAEPVSLNHHGPQKRQFPPLPTATTTTMCYSVHHAITSHKISAPSRTNVRDTKGLCVEQKRPKHSIPPVLSSPYISSLSRSSLLAYKPAPYVNFPKTVTQYPNTGFDNEVLDLSAKKTSKETNSFPQRPIGTINTECLDLSVKKKGPSPDTSGLPSGIENITPPPPPTGDECPATPIAVGCLTPLGSGRFYTELIADQMLIESQSKEKGPHHITSINEPIPSSSSSSSAASTSLVAMSSSHPVYSYMPMTHSAKQTVSPSHGTDPNLHAPPPFMTSTTAQMWTSTIHPSQVNATVPSIATHKGHGDQRGFPTRQSFPPQLYPYLYNEGQYYSPYTK